MSRGADDPGGRKDDGGEEGSFRVDDLRRFDPQTGEPRRPDPATPLPGGGVWRGESPAPEEAHLPVSFAGLVQPFLLLGLTGLGVLPHPETGGAEVDLRVASAAIDCLELLKTKTEGNRTPEETHFLDQALYELKMQFVEARERPQGK